MTPPDQDFHQEATNSAMKVIHLVSEKEPGSRTRYALDLSRRLSAMNTGVIYVSRCRGDFESVLRNCGAEVSRLPLGGALDIISTPAIGRALRRLPDREIVVHVHTLRDAATALNACRLADAGDKTIRVILTLHTDEAMTLALSPATPASSRAADILRRVDRVIFTSPTAMHTCLASLPPTGSCDSDRFKCVAMSTLIPREVDKQSSAYAPLADSPDILFTGRITPGKGLDVLLEALSSLTDRQWRLVVCGQGAGKDVSPLLRSARRLGISDRIDWRGNADNVLSVMKTAAICVLPHLQPASELPAVEALSQGVASVVTATGALPDTISDTYDGIVVAPGNPVMLTEALASLLDNPEKRESMGRNALHSFSQNHDFDKLLREVYQ